MDGIRNWLAGLYFSEPIYFTFLNLLWLLAAIVGMALIYKLVYRPLKPKYSQYQLLGVDAAWVAVLIICALSIISLAGPKIKKGMKLIQGGNIDVGFLVDYSFSMKADDIAGKSRLDIMKKVITAFIDSGELTAGDRVTLFIFGTHSIWRMPLSEDLNDFRSKLAEISHPAIYEEDSQLYTNLSNVIEHVPKEMDKQDGILSKKTNILNVSWLKNNRIMLLFSDGDDQEGADLGLGIKELNKRKIKIYSVGVGSKEGKKVTVETYDPDGAEKPPIKITIKTGLKMQRLKEIASKTGGESYAIDSAAGIGGVQGFLKNAVNANRSSSPRLVASSESRDIWWEVLAIPSLILMLTMIKKSNLFI